MEWMEIESAPKDGTPFLAYQNPTESWQDIGWSVMCWSGYKFRSFSTDGRDIEYIEPTHWMPLPAPPSTKE